MIRITQNGNNEIVCLRAEETRSGSKHSIHLYTTEQLYTKIPKSSVKKIEKQVKDLTLEEISKLKAQVIVMHTAPIKIVDEIPLYGSKVEKAEGKRYNTYKLDWNDHFYDLEDYIDITDLV